MPDPTPRRLTQVHWAPGAPDPTPPRAPGIDGATARRLRRGAKDPDARIDLHGMTADHAHRALVQFVIREQAAGSRLVLVITGKGGRREETEGPRAFETGRGVLRTLAPDWLAQPPLAGLVVAVYAAHRRHGGGGALYVYLRKRPDR